MHPTDQISIINEVVKNGVDQDVWYGYSIRGTKSHTDLEAYDNRLNQEFPWEYFATPLTDLVKKLMAPVLSFYTPTRIKIFVQKPGKRLREHCDKLEYKNNVLFRDFLKTEQFHDYFTEPAHQKQNCLALKIPISEIAGNNGNSYVFHEGAKYAIQPENHYYLFNESRLRHGADPCPHYRGVIFMDGCIDVEELEKMALAPLPVAPYG